MASTELTIGKLAKLAQVNIETIRYYQRIGLIVEPAKPAKGYRKYGDDTVNLVKFIKRAQQLGFSLAEIMELMNLGENSCSDIQTLAKAKSDKIKQQIKDLTSMQNELDRLIKACHTTQSTPRCAIIDTLSNN